MRKSGIECGRGERLYFRGTFVPVDFLWKFLADGEEITGFLTAYPQVTREIIREVIIAAGNSLRESEARDEPSFR